HFIVMALSISMVLFVAMPKPPVAHVTQIEFVPPPPPPPPEPEPPAPKPKLEAPKKVEQPKPQPAPQPKPQQVAVAIPTNEPPPLAVGPVEAPADEAPAAPVDNGGPAGGGAPSAGGDSDEIDFGSYLADMQRRIKRAWFPPKGNESKRISLKFKI